ncbi:MAG: PIG-L family deacetylase [Deltaproteobacteria bacterium]
MTTLVLSPHLDDAVLSLGGSIAAWVAAGARVVVTSIYTTGPPFDEVAPRMRKFADYVARRGEDRAACTLLGAEPRYLDQVERAFRRPYLSGWGFFRTPPTRAGFATLAQVTRALDSLSKLEPDRIVLPLGVGNHVDHVETLVAGTDWAIANGVLDRVWFYEDFYALSTAMRTKHPVTALRSWKRSQSPLVGASRLNVIMRLIAAGRRGPPVDELLAPQFRAAHWAATTTDVRPHEQLKLDAIECYASQIRAFGGFAGIARAIRAYHAWWKGGEPLWRADVSRS